ncbi:DNA repair rad16 [Fusarium longipes]|uniref:DNA repair rad16 n=1 Tax=Fusarium longipes TaxID=694270 RepID=A0A395SD20_9HYPO|nr:DNA repair rad16 [Fusarium longipes]
MADQGAASMSIEEIQEELTVQKVVLDSLDEADYDGVEEMRRNAHEEISRLKKLLRDLKQKKHSNICGQQQYTLAAMDSGWRHDSFSLPSRKRRAGSDRLSAHENQAKARRFSPPLQEDFANGSTDHGSIDFIDLTGDDDDIGSEFIVEQIKAEQRQKQEQDDRALATLLSQDSPDQTATQSPQNNAFTRLMSSQPPPGPPVAHEGSLSRMPGTYDAHWDDSLGAGPAFNIPQRQLDSQYIPLPTPANRHTADEEPEVIFAGSVARAPHPIGRAEHIVPGMTVGYPDLTRRGVYQPPHAIRMSGHSVRPPPTWVPASFASPSSLSELIGRTNRFDLANGVDGGGNPLPTHLREWMQDPDHDPYAAFQGPQLDAQELENLLSNISSDMDLPKAGLGEAPAGLKRPLYPHQDIALAWMKKMEAGTNKGGILADDMGLGKTISTLALLLARPATTRPKTNLIVAPVALIRQWEEEIATKTKQSHRLSVYVHHGKRTSIDELLTHDVVLTTYGSLSHELKRYDKFLEENPEESEIDWNHRTPKLGFPLLHPKAKFYRVILDEAQCIKNEKTQSAKACTQLKSTHRWCLTGTPMMNGVLELYSLVKFLKIRPYCKWEDFRQSFGQLFGRNGDPRSTAMRKLQVFLKAIMLRRKKNSLLDGKPILRLPEKTEDIVYATFSPEELDFYTQLEKNAQVLVSKYIREKSVSKNYSNILVLLLRLRQACCHPHLNLDVDDAPSAVSDEEKKKIVEELDEAIVERIKGIEAFECPICYDAVQCPSFFVPCGHDSCGECLVRIAESAHANNLQEGNESSRARCPVCRGHFDPTKCFSYDIFRQVHMPETIEQGSVKEEEVVDETDTSEDLESDSDYESDDEVDKKGNLKDFIVNDDFSDDEAPSKKKRKSKAKGKGKEKALDVKPSMLKTLRKEASRNRDAYKKYMRYLRKTWEPASKVTECLNLLKEIEETGEKTIVFSQWTLLLDLLQVAMRRENMTKPERYDGSMSATQRNIAAHNFRDGKDVRVMLVSLKAGNAGLNLTAASRVIIMDPFWNPYIEMQAVDRAYRIGQQKPVKVYRILTKETVEDRIVDLQNKKKEMVEAALDENQGASIGRLSENDLRNLFNIRD